MIPRLFLTGEFGRAITLGRGTAVNTPMSDQGTLYLEVKLPNRFAFGGDIKLEKGSYLFRCEEE